MIKQQLGSTHHVNAVTVVTFTGWVNLFVVHTVGVLRLVLNGLEIYGFTVFHPICRTLCSEFKEVVKLRLFCMWL